MKWRVLTINDRFIWLLFNQKLMKLLSKMPSNTFPEREARFYKASELCYRFDSAMHKLQKRRKANESKMSKMS
jgi:hypothetical protein